MEYKKVEKLYNKFMTEVEKLYKELKNLDNYIPVSFRAFEWMLELETASFEKQMRFMSWRTNLTLGFYDLVHSRGLNWCNALDGWIVLPFNVGDLPYSYDLDMDTLVDILTDGELRYNDCGYYGVYDFDEYSQEIYDESEAIEVFKRGLEQIKSIRNDKIPAVKKLCEELREQLDARKLFDDVLNEVAKSALGLTPYGAPFENGLSDEVFDFIFDEVDPFIVNSKLPRAIEDMGYTIARSNIEELYTRLTEEVLKSMDSCAEFMRGIYEEYYDKALRNLMTANEYHYDTDGVIYGYREQLMRGNFDDWYKSHVENQIPMYEIIEIDDELVRLINKSNK